MAEFFRCVVMSVLCSSCEPFCVAGCVLGEFEDKQCSTLVDNALSDVVFNFFATRQT